ncbi:hypothetical protein ACFZB9_21295 [Kitasatospora sp. NPDC008050]|uniref:hypothetical protein n=1 Tax=Kitasatospora sp. NPDC008050 TaxID=3364021 RepID=UPI0036DFAC0C
MGRATRRAAACAAAGLLAAGLQTTTAFAAPQNRIDLTVLVVDDGGPATAAITAELAGEGTPYTVLKLSDPNRATITPAFLSDTVNGAPRAKFQGVVLPNENPFGAGSAEMTTLASYEATFGIRQIDAYTYANPNVGLNWAQNPGYIGSLDGTRGAVTQAGLSGPFDYLTGSVPFEQPQPGVSTSYGYLATPLASLPTGASFTPLVDAPIPGTSERGSLVGEYDHDSRKELVVTFVYNQYQQQYRLLARGFVDWLTQGVHLGYDRNYFAVHVDDLFLSDDRWNTTLKCTPGDVTCPPGSDNTDTDPIRMTPSDVNSLVAWEKANNFTVDFAFNGGGVSDWEQDNNTTTDPLLNAFKANSSSFRFINHTWDHPFLGCVQNVTVVPWQCTTNAGGSDVWVDQATIQNEVQENTAWARQQGLPTDPTELITGEHSGLVTLPQQPTDNPNLAPALAADGIRWTASDASREPNQRAVGSSTLTVPRYPMNVFYNAGHTNEEVDEYNWIYTSKAQGGSGICETSGNSTCLPAPLDTTTGYASYIVPMQTKIDLGYVTNNDPRPNFIHQSNFAEDQIAYPVLNSILGTYKSLYAANTPMVNMRESQIGTELQQRSAWSAAVAAGKVTAYRIGNTVTVQAPAGVQVEATMPAGTTQQQLLGSSAFGTAYAGTLSGWVAPGPFQGSVTLQLATAATPSSVKAPAATVAAAATAAQKTAKAPRTTVPAGTAKAVPLAPGNTQRTKSPSLVPTSSK